MLRWIREWMKEREYDSVEQLKGSVSRPNSSDPEAYERANYYHVLPQLANLSTEAAVRVAMVQREGVRAGDLLRRECATRSRDRLVRELVDGSHCPARGRRDAVCIFVNDTADREVLESLAALGVRHVALRCAGFNNVDLDAANALGITVVRVPAYSPNAVAEHTIALILSLNRRIYKSYNRVREGNFSLEGLVGFDLAGKTAGVVGHGSRRRSRRRLLWHFRCEVICADPVEIPSRHRVEDPVRRSSTNCGVAAM
jgi:hypothetical protein